MNRTTLFHAAAAVAVAVLVAAGGTAAQAHDDDLPELPPGALLPDVIEEVPHHLQIQNTQQREFLRFSTTHINIGEGNLQIRGGGQVEPCVSDDIGYDECTVATQEILDAAGDVVATHDAGSAVFHPEHNHWHQSAVALFDIRSAAPGDDPDDPATWSTVWSEGVKITFCFVDIEFIGDTGSLKKVKPRTYFECNGELQGLASWWADSYHQSTPLQELDVTDVPDGEYVLTHLADPDGHWIESDETNNFTWVKFRLSRTSSNAKVEVLDHSPCEPLVICGFGGNP
ncbi:lysyl oxidase family protein [Agromyces sp. SYSU T0242]|uniref:lysyl oxidase family protein n=1 Tax=Agromyces litoreus TaxID=3158561 RepID=UPI00339B10F9